MHFKYLVASLIFLLIALALPGSIQAATADEVVDQYPVVKKISIGQSERDKISRGITQLLNENKHRDYPGCFLMEDVTKCMWWKGMEISYLAATLPYLDSGSADTLKSFLKYEAQNYLLNRSYYDFEAKGNLKSKLSFIDWQIDWWQWRGTDMEMLYGLWSYAHYSGDWNLIRANWSYINTILSSMASKSAKKYLGLYYRAPNSELAGRIGYARMAKKLYSITGDSAYNSQYQNQKSTIRNLLSGLTEYIGDSYTANQVCDFDATIYCTPETAHRRLLANFVQFDFLIPEIGRYIKDTYQNQALSTIATLENELPWWHLASYNVHMSFAGEEGYFVSPLVAYQIFQVKVQISNASLDELTKRLPWPTSTATIPHYWDVLNYANLISLAQRKEGVSWTDTNVSPTAISPGDQCPADIDKSGVVDITDYSLLVQNFFKTNPSPASSDINKDGIVDLSDYSLLTTSFFKSCS